jgi:hypothetical protein
MNDGGWVERGKDGECIVYIRKVAYEAWCTVAGTDKNTMAPISRHIDVTLATRRPQRIPTHLPIHLFTARELNCRNGTYMYTLGER